MTRNCEQCGLEFHPKPSNVRMGRGRFCSFDCYLLSDRTNRTRRIASGTTHPKYKHGLTHSITYKSWVGAKSRCYDSGNPAFHLYGGRGVTMCRRWLESFAAFFFDVGPRPSRRHSIDRYPDPSGNYEPGNVRWATNVEQQRNKRVPCKLTTDQAIKIAALRGVRTQQQLAAEFGVTRAAISAIHLGRIYGHCTAIEYRSER